MPDIHRDPPAKDSHGQRNLPRRGATAAIRKRTPAPASLLASLKRFACGLAMAAAASSVPATAALAAFNVWTSQYSFSRQELQGGMTAYFPRELQYLELVNIRLSDPLLKLDGVANRVVTRVNARISSPALLPAPMDGVLVVSSGLKYDAASRSVRLDRPRLERIDVPGVPAPYAAEINAIGNAVAEQFLANYPLHTFLPEELRLDGRLFEPRNITVTDSAIVVDIRLLP
jgi:hypothetical protein